MEMVEAVLDKVETYVAFRKNTVAQLIETINIMDLCLAMDRYHGDWVSQRWWGQHNLYLEVTRVAERAAEMAVEDNEEDGD